MLFEDELVGIACGFEVPDPVVEILREDGVFGGERGLGCQAGLGVRRREQGVSHLNLNYNDG